MTGPLFVVVFDERSDDGPDLCGPFRTRKAAQEWAASLPLTFSEFHVAKLWMPPDDEMGKPADRIAELEVALGELVDLKDGPRDEDYERRKPAAWDRARRLVR